MKSVLKPGDVYFNEVFRRFVFVTTGSGVTKVGTMFMDYRGPHEPSYLSYTKQQFWNVHRPATEAEVAYFKLKL